jgi:glycosyltransferase involved in cell wall biosynthesis
MTAVQPLVSVVTPVYNGAAFLVECIESVLKQSYANFEYIIINNCSTDNTLDIAMRYAARDSRVRIYSNKQLVPVIANHNIAFGLISPNAKYCKVVSADDFLFPDCILRMVEVAEAIPSVGIVGSYQLSGSYVRWQGFNYPQTVFPGIELCHRIFLSDDPTFGFGSPTSILYRADLIRAQKEFYPNSSPHSDTSACFQCLQTADFGFVYQVLSYEKTHSETQSSKSAQLNRYSSAMLNDLIQYGSFHLSKAEYGRQLKKYLNGYYQFLAVNILRFREKEFKEYHKSRLQELGYPLAVWRLLKAGITKILQEIVNPEQAIRKFSKRIVKHEGSL